MQSKSTLPCNSSVGSLGPNGKTITAVDVYAAGGVTVVAINYSGGPYYIKVRGNQVEVGGTDDWGTGKIQF